MKTLTSKIQFKELASDSDLGAFHVGDPVEVVGVSHPSQIERGLILLREYKNIKRLQIAFRSSDGGVSIRKYSQDLKGTRVIEEEELDKSKLNLFNFKRSEGVYSQADKEFKKYDVFMREIGI